jgi:GNAT superfamily N-acetyltransferase
VSELVIRPYTDADEDDVLDLLALGLGKQVDDRYRAFFRWKHLANPFGRSSIWLGEREGRLVGVRSFLRWRFVDPEARPVEAARAVDTVTHPDHQGQGIFRRLTLHGLNALRNEGVDFVFNTPNDQSRPANLTLGWEVEGRIPMVVRPRSPGSLWRMARARTAAEVWSRDVAVGEPIGLVLDGMGQLTPSAVPSRLVTDRSRDFLKWRYEGCPSVASRALPVEGGAVVVRFRRRGGALECTVGDVVGKVDPAAAGRAARSAMREVGADYAIATAGTPIRGMVTAPGLGPLQTRRAVSDDPSRLPLALALGDVEMF